MRPTVISPLKCTTCGSRTSYVQSPSGLGQLGPRSTRAMTRRVDLALEDSHQHAAITPEEYHKLPREQRRRRHQRHENRALSKQKTGKTMTHCYAPIGLRRKARSLVLLYRQECLGIVCRATLSRAAGTVRRACSARVTRVAIASKCCSGGTIRRVIANVLCL